MSRRWIALLAVLGLFAGLFTLLNVRTPPASSTALPKAADPTTPIVAIRGQPLAEHEEPLPEGAVVRIGSTRFRHPTELSDSDARRCGPYVVTRRDNSFTLTDSATGRRVWSKTVEFAGEKPELLSVAASPGGRHFTLWKFGFLPQSRVVGQLWQVTMDDKNPARIVGQLRIPEAATANFVDDVVFPADGKEVFVLTTDGIFAFSLESAQRCRTIPTKNRVLATDEHGRRFLTSSDHDPRLVFGVFIGSHIVPTYRFCNSTAVEAVNPPRTKLGTLIRDPERELEPLQLTVTDAGSGNSIFDTCVLRQRSEGVEHLSLSPNGRYLSFESDFCLTVFDIDHRAAIVVLDTWEGTPKSRSHQISQSWFSDDSGHFFVQGYGDPVHQFDLATGAEVIPCHEPPRLGSRSRYERSNRTISKVGTIPPAGDNQLPPGYAGAVMDYSIPTNLIVVGDATGRLDVWHPSGLHARTDSMQGKPIVAVRFSSDGQFLAACDRNGLVRIWRVESWRECEGFVVPGITSYLYPEHLTFSPDNQRVLVSRSDVLAMWDRNTREWLWDVSGYDFSSNASPPVFNNDGSRLTYLGCATSLDAETGKSIGATVARGIPTDGSLVGRFRWVDLRKPNTVAFSMSGSSLASIDAEGKLQVWDRSPDRPPTTCPEGEGVSKTHGLLRFSPDGRRLVTCDDHGHAHVWEVATGQLAFTINYPDGDIANAFFTKDGRSLITSNHREVIVWGLSLEPGAEKTAWADLTQEAPKAEQARRASS
jgi:WD40 repeat protein